MTEYKNWKATDPYSRARKTTGPDHDGFSPGPIVVFPRSAVSSCVFHRSIVKSERCAGAWDNNSRAAERFISLECIVCMRGHDGGERASESTL